MYLFLQYILAENVLNQVKLVCSGLVSAVVNPYEKEVYSSCY